MFGLLLFPLAVLAAEAHALSVLVTDEERHTEEVRLLAGVALGENVVEEDVDGELETLAVTLAVEQPVPEPRGEALRLQHGETVPEPEGLPDTLSVALNVALGAREREPVRVNRGAVADCVWLEDCEGDAELEPQSLAWREAVAEIREEALSGREMLGRAVVEVEEDTDGDGDTVPVGSLFVALFVVEAVGVREALLELVGVFEALGDPVPVLQKVSNWVEEAWAEEEALPVIAAEEVGVFEAEGEPEDVFDAVAVAVAVAVGVTDTVPDTLPVPV